MKLTMFERMVLANQYIIMLKLSGNEQYIDERWAKEKFEAIQNGYEMHYEHDGMIEEVMTAEESSEVIDTLNMYRSFFIAVKAHGQPKKTTWLKFIGYDGNYEGKWMAYAEYFCTSDHGRYEELAIKDFNSHCECKPHYDRMVEEWKRMGQSYELTKEQLESILAVA